MAHSRYEISGLRRLELEVANDLDLPELERRRSCLKMNPKDDDAPVLSCDGEAMRGFDETHRRWPSPESVDETRFRGRVSLEASGVPDLDESVLSGGDEEGVVWRDENSEDRPDVFRQLTDENGFRWS